MNPIELIHHKYVFPRRVRVLSSTLAAMLPDNAHVLDVGCGDGSISRLIINIRPDVRIEGVEVLQRDSSHIPVTLFDGNHLPFPDGSFDAVMFVDVLHHCNNQLHLLKEAARVARDRVVIKDHCADGMLAVSTLRFLDDVGNARYGVALPYNYWTRERWSRELLDAGLDARRWIGKVGLYPFPFGMIFDRSLHFVAQCYPQTQSGA